MAQREDNWPTVPEQELYPEITAVREPNERSLSLRRGEIAQKIDRVVQSLQPR